MAYSSKWGPTGDEAIIEEAYKRWRICEDWEAQARENFEYDYRFANADSINMFQWDTWVVGDRITNNRPCLTINKTMQHCLQIINDGKQNKPGINIRPVGDTASFEAAQIFQELVRHIEYVSNAETVYDSASEFQVIGGVGYWRVAVDYLNDPKAGEDNFAQEIFIKRIKDPRSVYLDPDTLEVDGSDANFGFIYSDEAKDLYQANYPDFADVGGSSAFDGVRTGWISENHVRVCEYFRKSNKKDKWVYLYLPETKAEIEGYYSELPAEAKQTYNAVKHFEKDLPASERNTRERPVVRGDIEWYKIAGDTIIDRGAWLGKYIPIIKIVGTETIIDGVLDRKGHTRALLDPQRIYNVNSSANVEFGALQSKSPVIAVAASIEGYEEYYRTANTVNHAWLPWNEYDEDGNKLSKPERMMAPQSSPAYVQQMQIAQNEMMMVTGQFQSQLGENENAKSGVAINARQRQGDRATYHFIDGEAIGIRYTGKILIDLIPKVYDKKRIMRIEAKDGSIVNLTIDPNAEQAFLKKVPDGDQLTNSDENIIDIIFNPNVGNYAVQSDNGPSFATRRQEAFNALTQIAASNKDFMNIAGDILWKVADFPEAQLLAQRWRRVIAPNILGSAPNPQVTDQLNAASAKIEQQLAIIANQTKELADKNKELDIKQQDLDLRGKEAMAEQNRLDYEAETKRLVALGNSGPGVSQEQIQPVLKELLAGMISNGELVFKAPAIGDGGTPIKLPEAPEGLEGASDGSDENATPSDDEEAPMPGAIKGKDGNFYMERGGQFYRIEQANA